MNMKLAISLSLAFFAGTASAGPSAYTCQGSCARYASTYEEYKQCVDNYCKDGLLSTDFKEVDESFVGGAAARGAATNDKDLVPLPVSGIYECQRRCDKKAAAGAASAADVNDKLLNCYNRCMHQKDIGVAFVDADDKNDQCTQVLTRLCTEEHQSSEDIRQCVEDVCGPSIELVAVEKSFNCNKYCENAYMNYPENDMKYILIDTCEQIVCSRDFDSSSAEVQHESESSVEAPEAEQSAEFTSIPNCEEYCKNAYRFQSNIEACKRVVCPNTETEEKDKTNLRGTSFV